MWGRSIVLGALLVTVLADVGIVPLSPKPDKFKHAKGCYISELDAVVPLGARAAVPPEVGCYEYICNTHNMDIKGCGSVQAAPPLRVVKDKTRKYPGCCPRIVIPHHPDFKRKQD